MRRRLPAYTLGGVVSGGGNQINNVIIGTVTPLAGSFTALSATGDITATGLVATRNDGSYQFKLVRSSAPARTYGFGVTTTGDFVIDDVTTPAQRWKITPCRRHDHRRVDLWRGGHRVHVGHRGHRLRDRRGWRCHASDQQGDRRHAQ